MTDNTATPNVGTYTPSRAQLAQAAQQQAAAAAKISPAVMNKINTASQNFESMFMSQMMQFVWSGSGAMNADETFGGGHAEEMWRGMLVDQYGSIASKTGSLGLADKVKAEMIRIQSAQQAATQQPETTTEKPL